MSVVRILFAILLLAANLSAESIRVAAAISLKEAVETVTKTYEAQSSDKIEFTFGSSGQLMAQIKNGAEIDVFISAANAQVDELIKENLVEPSTRRVVARNTLVLVVPPDAKSPPAGFETLVDGSVKKLSIGEPKTVPAGQYAMQVLTKLDLADKLKDRIVYGTNVRQVLSYVELGEVSAGIVYSTDAKESGNKVKVIAAAKPEWHDPIVYPAVIVKAGKKQAVAKRFLDFLVTDQVKTIFIEKGFSVAAESSMTPSR